MGRLRAAVAAVALALASPTLAADPPIEENEPLVMRIIFDDCLGFVRDGKAPFEGLRTYAVSYETMRSSDVLARHLVPATAQAAHLLNDRYVAVWGTDQRDIRVCLLSSMLESDEPYRLGVDPKGFLSRLEDRARVDGLSEVFRQRDDLTALEIPSYSEPGEASDELSFSVGGRGANAEHTIVDASLPVMRGRKAR